MAEYVTEIENANTRLVLIRRVRGKCLVGDIYIFLVVYFQVIQYPEEYEQFMG